MIGICLKYEQTNYGSKLQALATLRYLEKLELDYEILRYNKKTLGFIIRYIPRFFNWVFLNDRYDQYQRMLEFKAHPEVDRQVKERRRSFESFDHYFLPHLSKMYSSYGSLVRECPERYSAVLSCSDQLWSPSALGSGFYNLMFAPDEMKKISWASSFGVSKIPWYQIKRTKKYLSRIEHISMRENRGAEIVYELIGRKVPVLMDPVFAFDKSEWDSMIECSETEWKDYIFCYFLGSDPEHRTAARKFAEKTGKKILTLRHLDRYVSDDEEFGDIAPYDVDPVLFLNILRGAYAVCTDSFHGTAFSVIYEKDFVVFDRYSDSSSNSKNSRIDSLCANLSLEDRRCRNADDILSIMEKKIDWDKVKENTQHYRKATEDYLCCVFDGIH